jgi:preprotein translocase subunit Sss1
MGVLSNMMRTMISILRLQKGRKAQELLSLAKIVLVGLLILALLIALIVGWGHDINAAQGGADSLLKKLFGVR